jgi:hypothetical protein
LAMVSWPAPPIGASARMETVRGTKRGRDHAVHETPEPQVHGGPPPMQAWGWAKRGHCTKRLFDGRTPEACASVPFGRKNWNKVSTRRGTDTEPPSEMNCWAAGAGGCHGHQGVCEALACPRAASSTGFNACHCSTCKPAMPANHPSGMMTGATSQDMRDLLRTLQQIGKMMAMAGDKMEMLITPRPILERSASNSPDSAE